MASGDWINELCVITSGIFRLSESKVVPKGVMELTKKRLSEKHVLCPGLLGVVDLQNKMGLTGLHDFYGS